MINLEDKKRDEEERAWENERNRIQGTVMQSR